MNFSLISYGPDHAWAREAAEAEAILALLDSRGINWLNVDTLEDKAGIRAIAEAFGIHPLTVEDILDTTERPKIEEFEGYLFITLKARHPGPEKQRVEQVSLVLMENTVITFQEIPGDSFDGIRKRILNNAGRIRRMGPDYLVYGIIDRVVNDYFLIMDELGEQIEEFESRAIDEQDQTFITDIQAAKQRLSRLHRIIWPLREALSQLLHLESPLIREVTGPFFKDIYDGVIQCAESVESYRELVAGVIEINMSVTSNRMNSIMKVLTIISTIFIPLTFIVGVYGMNFAHMPELSLPYAYPVVWGVMVIIVICMIAAFKKRRWL